MRQFLCDSFPDSSGKLIVKGKNYRYLVKVLRFSEGEELDARLPDGNLVRFFVERIQKEIVVLKLSEQNLRQFHERELPQNTGIYNTSGEKGYGSVGDKTTQGVQAAEIQDFAERTPNLWLFQFLPKPQKMDLIVRQATECGVRYIVPICGAFSVKNDSSGRKERWERIIREARQQSGSAVATEIKEVMSVRAAADMWKQFVTDLKNECAETDNTGAGVFTANLAENGTSASSVTNCDETGVSEKIREKEVSCVKKACAFILDENPSSGKNCLSCLDKTSVSAAAIAVGCEGGISDEERKVLLEAEFMPLHFTTNVLRAETASLYGIAVIQQFFSAD